MLGDFSIASFKITLASNFVLPPAMYSHTFATGTFSKFQIVEFP